MTDKDKILLLQKENRNLKKENTALSSTVAYLQKSVNDMASMMKTTQDLKVHYEQALRELQRFKKVCRSACLDAMKTTVRPYDKAIKSVRAKSKQSSK